VDTPAVLNELVVSLIETADKVVIVSHRLPNIQDIKLGCRRCACFDRHAKLLLVMTAPAASPLT